MVTPLLREMGWELQGENPGRISQLSWRLSHTGAARGISREPKPEAPTGRDVILQQMGQL